MPNATGPSTTYAVLGTLAVTSSGHRRGFVGRERLLLAHLLVERGRIVAADRLVHALWADDLPRDPGAALRSQVSRLRRRLPAGDLVAGRGGYGLEVGRSELDATRFEDLVAAAAEADAVTAVLLLEDALALWRGPAFEPVADREFAQAEALRLEELRLRATEQRAELLLEIGDAAAAADDLAPVVHGHPEREHARALLMEVRYRQGRHTDALELYQRWREHLAERGLEPAPGLRSLERRILTHDLAPGVRTPRSATIPRPVTSFVGRDIEVRRVVELVTESRLVTLCGPGGVGKTRLALEATSRLIDGGQVVHHCDLAAIDRGTHLVRAVAVAAGAERPDSRPREDHLIEHLADTPVVLVLDNCEHVIDAVARLADRLLRHTSAVRLVATSREPLGVDGERVLPVAPLELGSGSPALELFRDRARAANPDIELGPEHLADAEAICARLDGLPLAIELAAGRLRTMTVRELAAVLGSGLELLESGPRATPRHRSLRSVIDWSYNQLDEPARLLFEALSVFAGEFDIDGAAAVAAPNGPGASAPRVAAEVARLVDCSLLSTRRTGEATTYRMLDTLRAYAHERLDAAARGEEVRDRHAAWAVSLAEEAAVGLRGADEAAWVQRVHQHLDDLRRAHERLVGRDIGRALRLSAALHPFAMWRGHGEVFEWAEIAVAAAGGTRPASLIAALGSAAVGRAQRGELDGAEAAAHAALRAAADRSGARIARGALAEVQLLRGEVDEAVALYRECHDDAMADGDRPQAVWSLGSAALAHLYGGRPRDAADLAATTVRHARESQNPSAVALAEFVLGEIGAATGDDDAEAHLRRAIAIASTADSRFVEGLARVTLATLQVSASDTAHALDHYFAAIRQWGRHNAWAPQWVTLRHLVDLLARHGATTDAAVLYGAVTSNGTGAPPFGSDADLLEAARNRIEAQIGTATLSREAGHGSMLSGEEIVATALRAITALRASLSESPAS